MVIYGFFWSQRKCFALGLQRRLLLLIFWMLRALPTGDYLCVLEAVRSRLCIRKYGKIKMTYGDFYKSVYSHRQKVGDDRCFSGLTTRVARPESGAV